MGNQFSKLRGYKHELMYKYFIRINDSLES